ncbi:MAG: hypothetical protein AB7H97_00090 [Pseudobdellovibrionaceae bacterium]
MEKQVNSIAQNSNESNQYYRFQVFQGMKDASGKVKKTKSVGMAYLKEGQNIFSLRLWMFSWDRYFILPHKADSSKYLVMTREPNRSPKAKNKYFWNIVGNGTVDSVQGVIELEFDLLSKPIYVNIHPEPSAQTSDLPEPDSFGEAA